MKKKAVKLPSKPSALLTLALKDLRKVEKDKKYVVDMSQWHQPEAFRAQCHVCLAGSVLAKTCKLPVTESLNVQEDCLAESLEEKLKAIDCFRAGNIPEGLQYLGISPKKINVPGRRNIVDYHENKEQFYKDMQTLIQDFKTCGL